MYFIVDAHLPWAICEFLKELGHKSLHTTELQEGNHTSDEVITALAVEKHAIVISKDTDFYHKFLLKREPPKLVMVKVGNMRLAKLKALFKRALPLIIESLATHDLIELHQDKIIGID